MMTNLSGLNYHIYRTASTPGILYAPYIAGLLAVLFALSLKKIK
tara:strand:- start:623 stop:754 length:132 start_codon:yes stop_codon:yes gene_type:complete